MSSEAAEDQGHGPPPPKPKPQTGVRLPSQYECEVGVVGVAQTRKAIAAAKMAKAVGEGWDTQEDRDG